MRATIYTVVHQSHTDGADMTTGTNTIELVTADLEEAHRVRAASTDAVIHEAVVEIPTADVVNTKLRTLESDLREDR